MYCYKKIIYKIIIKYWKTWATTEITIARVCHNGNPITTNCNGYLIWLYLGLEKKLEIFFYVISIFY